MNDLKEKYKLDDSALLSQDEIGASIGKELTRSSILAVLVAFVMILVYVGIRFEFKFGSAAVIAVIHDILLTISFYAIFRVPVNTPFIAAILTVVGYSINDTIVIFDRIREDSKKMRRSNPVSYTHLDVYKRQYLLQQGFIIRTPRGRIASDKAYEHLGRVNPSKKKNNIQVNLFDEE